MPGNRNSGRKPEWFREACADIINKEKLIDFVGRVAAGREVEERLIKGETGGHEIVTVSVCIQDRLAAFKMLAEWGVGKPVQYVATAPRSPEESVMQVQKMLELVKQASQRPVVIVPDAAAAKRLAEGNGANGHH